MTQHCQHPDARFCLTPLGGVKSRVREVFDLRQGVRLMSFGDLRDLLEHILQNADRHEHLLNAREQADIRNTSWFLYSEDDTTPTAAKLADMQVAVVKAMNLVQRTPASLQYRIFGEWRDGKLLLERDLGGKRLRKPKLKGTEEEYPKDALTRVRDLWPTIHDLTEWHQEAQLALAIQFWWVSLNQEVTEVRIVLLITALETLFSSSSQEIGYSLRTRLARFIGSTADERREIVTNTKTAYAMRSTVVHGGLTDKPARKLRSQGSSYEDLEAKIESHFRTAVLMILDDPLRRKSFTSGKKAFEQFWQDFDLT